jgi:hypothetical protein
MFEGARTTEDPGLATLGLATLRADRLVLSMRETQVKRGRTNTSASYIDAAIGWIVIAAMVWIALVVLP